MKQQFVDVAVPPIRTPLTYLLPTGLTEIDVGYRVLVPLGKREVPGFVVGKREEISPEANFQPLQQELLIPTTVQQTSGSIRPILRALDGHVSFDPGQMDFFRRVADYYGEAVATVIDAAVPTSSAVKQPQIVKLLAAPPIPSRSSKRDELIKALLEAPQGIPLKIVRKRWKGIAPILQKLIVEGYIQLDDLPFEPTNEVAPLWAKTDVSLSSEQSSALNSIIGSIRTHSFQPYLLHGVTGSGKTEVYIEAIREALHLGGSALLVVPEISLTPQLIDRFRARLGNNIAVLHSALTRKTRWEHWRSLIEGRTRIAIGARSAIFAPLSKLSLVIVDEEHDPSFKQSDGFRYHGRDLAVLRAQFESCPVVLGSATPALESFFHARKGHYNYLPLSRRHGIGTPLHFEVVDMSKIKAKNLPRPYLSQRLFELLSETVNRGEQAFVLYNRRGFASYLQCDTCNTVKECRNCSVTLTYHQVRNMLVCHYCGYCAAPESFCTACRDDSRITAGKLLQRGAGTERIFDDLRSLLPGVRIDRMDRDSATTAEDYRLILDRVRSGTTQILVGTQMIAKGHDLPNVTLVGVVDCDVGLHFPDFRASERVFQLLTQVSGRAGRAEKPGTVLLQTRVPSHISLTKTVSHDYEGLAVELLKSRKEMGYPPYCRLLRIIASSMEDMAASDLLSKFRDAALDFIEKRELSIGIIGPAPAPLHKLKGLYRWHLLVKGKSASAMNAMMKHLREIKYPGAKIRVAFDVDPVDML